ncbi:response regulator [Aquimarina hainanensis]|uniref:histidine kinase n=1 Tax=Aquimarina hainanensis TaxID=1578017 RepID=A0ABW5N7R2_9FLAO
MAPRKSLFLPLLILIALLGGVVSCSKEQVLTKEEANWLHTNDSIKIALFPYYPPYQFINDHGDVEGILIEYLEHIEDKLGYTFDKVPYTSWTALMEDVKDQKIEVVLEMQKTKGRMKYLRFTEELFRSPFVLIGRDDIPEGTTLEDLKDKKIIVPDEFSIEDHIRRNYPYLDVTTFPDDLSCLRQIQEGNYDLFIGPKAVVHYLTKANNLDKTKVISQMDHSYAPGIAVNKGNPLLNAIISKASKSISYQEKQEIVDNWLYKIVKPFYKKNIFWVILSVAISSLLISILLINFYLKFKIKQKTKELQHAKEVAEESNHLKTAFINNISHEVRTPMNGIIGFSQFLSDPQLTTAEKEKCIKVISNCSKQLMNIIDDILELSRLETKQVKIMKEETNLSHILMSLFSVFNHKAHQKNIQLLLENKLRNDEDKILIDKAKLIKTLNDLLDNAIKFTEEGTITIFSKVEKEQLIISIQDTGIGVEPGDQEIIFQNFSQVEKEVSKRFGGLGLGLSIAQKNVQLMKGTISFSSKVGEGSIFTITLPHTPLLPGVKQFHAENTHIIDAKPDRHIILIAEDGDINFLLLKTLLTKMKHCNFLIHRAKNGKEAVDICRENDNIHLVLMDIKMPVMDGYDATKMIKRIRPDLPIIAQTAYSTVEDIQRAMEAGCDDFVSKPIDHKILKPIIRKYF